MSDDPDVVVVYGEANSGKSTRAAMLATERGLVLVDEIRGVETAEQLLRLTPGWRVVTEIHARTEDAARRRLILLLSDAIIEAVPAQIRPRVRAKLDSVGLHGKIVTLEQMSVAILNGLDEDLVGVGSSAAFTFDISHARALAQKLARLRLEFERAPLSWPDSEVQPPTPHRL